MTEHDYRGRYIGKSATLNGKHATIMSIEGGRAAAVVSNALSGECSWEKVNEVMTQRGGNFRLTRGHLATNPNLQDRYHLFEDKEIGTRVLLKRWYNNRWILVRAGKDGKVFRSLEAARAALNKEGLIEIPYGPQGNPILETLGVSLLTGVGLGAGFSVAKKLFNHTKDNPVNYARTIERYGYLSDDFIANLAMRRLELTPEKLESIVGRYVKGKRKGFLKGKLIWKKVLKGGWYKTGIGAGQDGRSSGFVVTPESTFDYMIVDSWTGATLYDRGHSGRRNPLTNVHPEALESLKRYKEDLRAGHTDAAEYWRGQAGAYFTANPKRLSADEMEHQKALKSLDRKKRIHKRSVWNLKTRPFRK